MARLGFGFERRVWVMCRHLHIFFGRVFEFAILTLMTRALRPRVRNLRQFLGRFWKENIISRLDQSAEEI